MDHIVTKSDEQALKEGCYFDPVQAERPIKFIHQFFRSKYIAGPITLLPWQADLIRRLYGWRNADGTIRHKRATISTAKKNGKNLIGSAVCLYELFGGSQPSPEVVSASTTASNSAQIYRELCYSIDQNELLKKHATYRDSYREIRVKSKHGKYRGFSSDAGNCEGENISCVLVDELHAHESDALFRSLEHATSSRPNGFLLCISTAGVDQSRVWYSLFKYAEQVQNGEIVDTTVLPFICTAHPEADIDDPKTWAQANPSLGTSFTEATFRKALNTAKQEGMASLLSFRRYKLNQWVAGEAAYMDPAKWDACKGFVSEEELQYAPLFLSLDGSSTTDPTSVTGCWALPDHKFFIRSHSWVCEGGARRRDKTNLPKYTQYAKQGDMTITKGEVIDHVQVKQYILAMRDRYNLRGLVMDPNKVGILGKELETAGVLVHVFPQTPKYYTSAMKNFEVAVNERRIVHEGSDLLRWALANTVVDQDPNGNCRPDRGKSTDKIDPAVTALMAFEYAHQIATTMPTEECVYNTRPVLTI